MRVSVSSFSHTSTMSYKGFQTLFLLLFLQTSWMMDEIMETRVNATQKNDSVSYFKLQRLNGSFQSIHFGESYSIPKSPSHQLEDLDSSVAVLIIIDNWTNKTFEMESSETVCGSGLTKDRQHPLSLSPFTSEILLLENGGGLSGVCGSFSFLSREDNTHVHLMWSVPYNLNTYDTYFGVGVTKEVPDKDSDTSIFQRMYYGDNDIVSFFKRGRAGEVIEYSTCSVIIKGYIQPANYKPIMSVSIAHNERQVGYFNNDEEALDEGDLELASPFPPAQESLIQEKNELFTPSGPFNESELIQEERNLPILQKTSILNTENNESLFQNSGASHKGSTEKVIDIMMTFLLFINCLYD